MTVTFELTREEYLEACFAEGRRKARGRLVRVAGYITVVLGAALFMAMPARNGVRVAPIALIIVGLGILIVPVWSAYTRMDKQWKDSAGLRGAMTVDVDERRMAISGSLWSSEIQWGLVSDFSETQRLLLIHCGTSTGVLTVPKRAFATSLELEQFRALVARHKQGGQPPDEDGPPPDDRSTGGFEVIITDQKKVSPGVEDNDKQHII